MSPVRCLSAFSQEPWSERPQRAAHLRPITAHRPSRSWSGKQNKESEMKDQSRRRNFIQGVGLVASAARRRP